MRTLGIDIETYCSVDLTKAGVYAYASAPDFSILLFAYAFDNEPIQIVDIASGETLPADVADALVSPETVKAAFNANFERVCLEAYLKQEMPPEQWRCTMVHAWTLGLAGGLEHVGKSLKLPEQKMKEGKALIKYFSMPCKPTIVNKGRTRNLPEHAPEKWELFKSYCVQDVEVERTIRQKLAKNTPGEDEQALWSLDQRINDRGVLLDMTLVRQAIACDNRHKEKVMQEALSLTGLENPNSVAQLKSWLARQGVVLDSVSKDALVEVETENPDVKRMIQLRSQIGKTSVKKYSAMENMVCEDGRVRGVLQFYGAGRTGRWAGRKLQPHNLPKNYLNDLDVARELVRGGHFEMLELLYDDVSDVLSQLLRTAFIPSKGCRFIVSDFSAIEARVIAWLAGEKWRLDVFNGHGKIYEASAAQMFKVPVESIDKGSPLRQKGKIAELALGYNGGKQALISMGALNMGLDEEELQPLVTAWRKANPAIKRFWHDTERAAKLAITEKSQDMQFGLRFQKRGQILFIRLPSRRELAYVRPRIEQGKWSECIAFEGINGSRNKTFGGKLVENIVQAVARDCLAVAMTRLSNFDIALHVHDEVVLDVPHGVSSADEVAEIMGEPISWAKGLPLCADAYETDYYKKD